MKKQKSKKVGITGGIGSGKSIVAKVVTCMGYPVFYSDLEAKAIIENDELVRQQLQELFGNQAYSRGFFNTKYVSERIFRDPSLREMVNAIVHPAVRQRFQRWAETQDAPLVFNEAAILFETGGYKQLDATILVTAPEEVKIERVMKRDKCGEQAVRDRMAVQWTDAQKMEMTSLIVVNDENHPVLTQVEEIIQRLLN